MTQEILGGWGSCWDALPAGESGAQLPFRRTSLEFSLGPCVLAMPTTPRAWALPRTQQDSEAAASAAAAADSGNIPGRRPSAGRARDAACSSPQALGPGGDLVPAESVVNPPPVVSQFPSAARLARLKSNSLGSVGWSCASGSAVPGRPSSPTGIRRGVGAPPRCLCPEPVPDKRGRRVTASGIGPAQLHCPGQPLCPPLLPDSRPWLGCPVPTDGGGSRASMDASNASLC